MYKKNDFEICSLKEAQQKSSMKCEMCNPPELKNYTFIIILGIVAAIVLYKVASLSVLWIRGLKKKGTERNHELELDEKQRELEERLRYEWLEKYAGKDLLKEVNAPEDAYVIGALPATKGNGKYGKYTVYVSAKGKCFHQSQNCGSNLLEFNYYSYYNRRPCARCVKSIPEIQWVIEYNKIITEKRQYGITEEMILNYKPRT